MIEIKNNAILRDGDEIGSIDGDVATMGKKQGPAILGQNRKAAGNPSLQFTLSESIAPGAKSAQTKDTGRASTSGKPVEGSSTTVAAKESGTKPETASVKTGIDRLLELVAKGKIPPPPPKHPAMGDKDPAFVAWYSQHATAEESALKYPPGKSLPTMEAFEEGERKRKVIRSMKEKKDTAPENDFSDKE